MTVDTHTHAWEVPTRDHPWVTGELARQADGYSVDTVYEAVDLLADMDAVGVDEAVVVNYPLTEWTDNSDVIRAVREHDRLYGIVTLDEFADDAPERVREYAAVDGILGLRLGAICPRDRMWRAFDPGATWLRDLLEEWDFWAAVHETDTLVQVLAHVDQLDQAVEMVERYPDVRYVFDHFGLADPAVAPADGPFARFADLAEYDSVAVKLSEVVHRSVEPFPYEDVHTHAQWFVDTFGRDRVAWGSDYPNVSDEASYEEALTWLEHVPTLSSTDRRWLTERTFEEFFVP